MSIKEKAKLCSKKPYEKPAWEKQELFEKFAVTCAKHPQPAQACTPPRSVS